MPNCLRNVAANPSPMPGTPGTLSTVSPVKRQEIDDLVGADAPFFFELGGVDDLVLAQIQDADLVADQLAGVFVGRDDEDVEPRSSARRARVAMTSSASIPAHDENGDAKALEHAADHGDLRHQVGGHFLAVGLVVGIDVRAEDAARAVEGGRQVVGLAVPDHVEQVAEDPEDGLGRLPGRACHFGNRVEYLEDEGEGVQDIETGPCRHRSGVSLALAYNALPSNSAEPLRPARIKVISGTCASAGSRGRIATNSRSSGRCCRSRALLARFDRHSDGSYN